MKEFSNDLVEEILSRIPATSLARLKHTCKQWKTIISDPRFVKKHMSDMRGREQQFTVFNSDTKSKMYCAGIDFDIPRLSLRVFEPVSDLPVTPLSHCDGLLLYVMKANLLVLNPLLNQARYIKHGCGFKNRTYTYGLGYMTSDQCNDYKIVRFFCERCVDDRYRDSRTEVYDFKSDSWKLVSDKTSNGFLGKPKSSVCLRGTPYWIGGDFLSQQGFSLQSFDFSKERFEPLSHPGGGYLASLGVFRGDKLSLLLSPNNSEMHMWVMNQQQQDWIKLITVAKPNSLMISKPYSNYFIENNGRVALYGRHDSTDGGVRIYVLGENQECQKVKYCLYPPGKCQCRRMARLTSACFYVPSLLQVPGCSK